MLSSTAVPMLMFGTLGIVLVIAAILVIRHLRNPANRHPMDNQRERNIDEIRRGDPPQNE